MYIDWACDGALLEKIEKQIVKMIPASSALLRSQNLDVTCNNIRNASRYVVSHIGALRVKWPPLWLCFL